jgi:hypothetical protein
MATKAAGWINYPAGFFSEWVRGVIIFIYPFARKGRLICSDVHESKVSKKYFGKTMNLRSVNPVNNSA